MSEDVKKIRIEEFDYDLPPERIAKYPLKERDSSRLLISRGAQFETDNFYNLASYLDKDVLLLFNETRVIQARLLFPLNDRTVEVFCLEPMPGMDIQQAMSSRRNLTYQCLVGGARRWKKGPLRREIAPGEWLSIEKGENHDGVFAIHFTWEGDHNFAGVLEICGHTPLPPYLQRAAEESDRERYQTVFARNEGSVAAPTASLHFTPELLQRLQQAGIQSAHLNLHVGAGTFKPVSAEEIRDHQMHAEEISIERSLVEKVLHHYPRPIIPVGTTSMRALESMYWLGYLAHRNELPQHHSPLITQWIPYNAEALPVRDSLEAILQYMDVQQVHLLQAKTALMIAPGYRHRLASGIVTNFHQPRSTLLLLIASLMGDKWKSMYKFALAENFRFLSYGDSCLILKDRDA